MLYLNRITIHNFKSFRHENISFGQGFSCIVGPNGSGKSNICDAILFSLGETSLKRLRVASSASLINAVAKPKKEDGVKRAYVHVFLSGDEDIDIARIIKSNNKIAYRINGRRAARQDIIDVLRMHKAEINETNTITQGEITRILNLSPKERRELIDVAAGIKEFDDKKDAAIKELDKVEAKISESNIMLSERQGFLKELEKEKADAERYIDLSGKIKSISYTILKDREEEIADEYKKAVADYEKFSSRKKELEDEIKSIEDEISSTTSYKEKLSKKMNEGSIELSTTNKIFEEINSGIKIMEIQIANTDSAIAQGKEKIMALKGEKDRLSQKISLNIEEIAMIKEELEKKTQELSSIDTDTMVVGGREIADSYYEYQKKLSILENELAVANSEYAEMKSEASAIEKSIIGKNDEISGLKKEHSAKVQELGMLETELSELNQGLENQLKLFDSCRSEIQKLQEQISKIDSDKINLREALAVSGRNQDKIAGFLMSKIPKGILGKAADLCSYEEKYANAVYAAASSRLNYIITNSISDANRAIELLKENSLGRTSFIPLDEIISSQMDKKIRLKPLIEVVTFDEKYRKAFEYIFSNTFIAATIKEAKAVGIGKHRFVTLDGELVDQSGVVTGGKINYQQPLLLESKLKRLEMERAEITKNIAEFSTKEEKIRKEISSLEIKISGINANASRSKQEVEKLQGAMERLFKEVEAEGQRLLSLDNAKAAFAKKKIDIEKAIEGVKAESDRLYSSINKMISGRNGGKSQSKDGHDIKGLREKIETNKVAIASFEKENEMNSERIKYIIKEVDEEELAIKDLFSKKSECEAEISNYNKKKVEIQSKIKSHSQSSATLLKELQESDEKLSNMGFRKGRLSSDRDKLERDIMESESKRLQHQTRLSDIKAELLSYSGVEAIEHDNTEELEKMLVEYKHEIELLGNINLKAPEAYLQKKNDVDEATRRLATLSTEKESILAMISEIDSKKLNVFNDTFDQINKNFSDLYSHIFDGSASIHLDNKSDPFNSKLQFNIQMAGKKNKSLEELSGGQKSLILLLLIFSIQMRKPMAFYIFDEIDVSLDKENSKKLSKLIKELSKNSQFILVSHNDSLIAAADTAIGVTQQDTYSKVVGIKVSSKNGQSVA